MRTISAVLSVTLDGVVQGLGRPDEDTRGGFELGGWGRRYQDEVLSREMAGGMGEPGDMLFGRRTWEDFIGAWAHSTDGNPFTEHMNGVTKYVVSRSRPDVSAWRNSILLGGEAVQTVAALKAEDGPPLSIIGSAALVSSLQSAQLIDTYCLLIHPLVLGRGTRLFEAPGPLTEFELTGQVATTTGVIIAYYRRS